MAVDLIDYDGKFSPWEKLSQKFNLSAVDFLEWYGILHSIPKEWKNIVKENTFLPETLDKQVLFKFHHGVFKGTYFYDILKVLMISPTCIMISPHGTEHPHSTQDNPYGTHETPHGTEHPHGTQDIPHGT